jgi:hypothetical protein
VSSFVALVAAVSLLVPRGVVPTAQSDVAAPQAPAAAEGHTTEAVDGGWPRTYIADAGAQLTLYEPQVASWVDQKQIVMYFAVSHLARGEKTPALGTIRVEADVIGLDRVLAALDASQVIPKNVAGIKADPPAIVVSQDPAVLVNLDGEPIWSPIKDNELRFAVNTNWDLFEHSSSGQLRLDEGWPRAAHLSGSYRPSGGGSGLRVGASRGGGGRRR